ncbi:MAG: hypothetical protein ACW986_01395 [Promethearchaeota archaeon]|jgi:hypothetical protein
MKDHHTRTFSIITLVLFSIFLISLFQNIGFTHAQGNGGIPPISSRFEMIEYSENADVNTSISSIGIPLPSETWNVTDLKVNISDIKLGQETVSIEENGQSIHIIDSKGKLGYGVEINFTEPTTIFGVYIYGYMTGTPVKPVYIQIQGYDGGTNSPNEIILGTTLINISTPGWHLQMFEEEVSLPAGNYYLVINGSEMTWPADQSKYNWLYNGSGSLNANLHTAVLDGSSWSEEDVGKPLLYKLVQRVNRSFNPEEVNMTAMFNGFHYPILDGVAEGSGHLFINETLAPNGTILELDIINNRSIELLFNVSYIISIQNILISDGQITIKENSANSWFLTPSIERLYSNYSVKFTYPNSWYNFSVMRDGFDITSEVIINGVDNYILIQNNTILPGVTWEISANSPNIELSLNIPKTNFQPQQDLEFSVLPPVNPGNLTYVLINSLGFKQYNETRSLTQVTSQEIVFSYTLSANPNEGVYKAYIYWFDGKNAGIKTQEFQVNVPFSLDPMYIVIIIVGISTIAAVSISSYKLAKRSKRIHEELRQKIFNKYMDVVNLEYFIIIEKRTGLNIYEQIIAGEGIDDAALITGFLEAIRNFGIELTGANEQSQTIKLEYQNSKIIMSEFKDFRILLIMKENPSQDFLDSVKALSYDIDDIYGEDIANFKGNIDKFVNIKELLDKHLETSLIYPLEYNPQDIKLSSDEKSMINRAKDIMKMKNTDYFFVSYMLYTKKGFQTKDAEILLNLIDKKIFQPKI